MWWLSRSKQVALVGIGAAIGFNGLVVAVAPERIEPIYGVAVDGADGVVLLRHRAVMLALIGSLVAASAFRRELRPAAVSAAALSMASFALFALPADVSREQRRVAVVDVALLAGLAVVTLVPDRPGPRREPDTQS